MKQLLVNVVLIFSFLAKFNSAQNPVDDAIVVDAGTQETTQFGTKINNTDSLQAGLRGPTLLEDFMLREKVMHFDHERIPERVVHARGFGVHGYFEPYKDFSNLTAAKFLRTPEVKTPTFVRFSTVLGSRGSPDTVRDVRGFATRFYTQEGNWDLVGNIIAPFFIQDGIKFPDLIHAAKPEPDTEVPQAGTAHCTAYDFFSQHTEATHTLMWALSGRGLAKNFRQVEGFGTHTFRLINEDGETVLVKFIWKPLQGLANLVWDEAQKIAGKDIDYHRNDMYTAIERGDFPEYELGVQIIQEYEQDDFDFDLLDATKIIPESIAPFQPLGKMTLNRNVDNFFAETEQVAFHVGNIVRGITFTNDPLLAGRLFSYTDTQVNRMNSVNFNKLPINRPLVPVHNNQRDGYMQPNVFKGKVAYFPNSAQGNTPSVVSRADGGYLEYPERINANKQRGKGQKFSDHYSQATLFWNSLTTAEQQQTVDNARFEIGKCTNATIRSNMVQVLNHVDNNFAVRVAFGVGVDAPEPVVDNHNQTSIGLSIENYPRPNHIRAKRVAILTAPGIYTAQAQSMYDYLLEEGAYPDFIGFKLGDQDGLNITQTYVTISPVLYDAVYVPSGDKSAFKLLADNLSAFPYEEPIAFILDTYRHGKPIAVSARGQTLLKLAKLPASALYGNTKSETTYGVFIDRNGNYLNDLSKKFRQGIIKQRYWARLALDPNAKESLTPSNISIVDDLENMFK